MNNRITKAALAWLGFGDEHDRHGHHHHDGHDHDGGHGHTHGVIDPSLTTTEHGIWAIKWSFIILALTAIAQLVIALWSGSVALLADTIHNVGDAATAIPLWIAFRLARWPTNRRFTYGYGRVEDLAGVMVVLIILFSALFAGYEAIQRFLHPQAIGQVGWVALAGVLGFIGNEVVAVFRIRVGRRMNSAALIADGYHARTDGLTSLAVVIGALGVWLGFPLADPVIGLLITLAIFGIVWQSTRAAFTRLLDGVEPDVIDEIEHAAGHVDHVQRIDDVRARWLGHKLAVELRVGLEPNLSVAQAGEVTSAIRKTLTDHLPALDTTRIEIAPDRI
ncbi:cation diffusion facilitator family transporter [Salinisphaera sp.]|uniref:cation diffusion facilitator family transporter n=1 Tax=Salinisphaera sp. TaxID=1914330 RepID=UPI002D7A1483|nr:cation diffusion facilitator family transporter [Salinisphaera sp.]HET7313533.1 cation diffusion facilitator family transporter [Salinisphaera sp.]